MTKQTSHKRIAIFCDGTWNSTSRDEVTNVVLLSQSVARTAPDGIKQIPLYVEGVGTGRGSTGFAQALDKLGGGAFGWGLENNLKSAFSQLALIYEPGDQIYIFGFSRGAYTARSLAGLIRSVGIPSGAKLRDIDKAMAFYRDRTGRGHPKSDASRAFRADFSEHVVTGREENEWRRKNGFAEGHLLKIDYLGVWDTVGALGLPSHYGAISNLFNNKYGFHDMELSSMIASARHAVAIDERRKAYPPSLWDNLDLMNDEVSFEGAADNRPYQQIWFPGVHGAVGGGGPEKRLSNITLEWVADGAIAQGLAFMEGVLADLVAHQDPMAPLDNAKVGFLTRLMRRSSKDREMEIIANRRDDEGNELRVTLPPALKDVSEAARARWVATRLAGPAYAPQTLSPLQADLDGLT
ncbi:DUF2235 domain-containing protein [Nereida sp. MMG025]|uniref:DUF2235 domain-containing protein n=1 Tax=Nereida sp. MMG025 TaxID=2909981 RepID=UPI001F492781|nr:DUF2235 domain-containing protein [Nereida sp. MMG025]MCF6445093.1 DUF2235 domain-containing protein [Nereida sp. MMG025]